VSGFFHFRDLLTVKIYNNHKSPARQLGTVVLLLAFGVASTGCVLQQVNQKRPDPVAQSLDSLTTDDDVIAHEVTDENVARLWQEAEILTRSGDLDSARGRLQQAILITPKDPVLWSRVAELELRRDEFLRAENYAAKSNFLATIGNRQLRYRNWLIIQRSREGRGDLLGAREAGLETTQLGQ